MVAEEVKQLISDDSIDNEIKKLLLPLLFEERKSRRSGPLSKFFLSAPFAALLSAVLVAGITEILRQQTRGEELSHERTLEHQRFQYEVITTSLSEERTRKERAETLEFLHDIGILDGLDAEQLAEWSSGDSAPPAFTSSTQSSNSDVGISGPVRLTVNEYRRQYGEDVYGPSTEGLLPTSDEFYDVLGSPDSNTAGCLVPLQLPYQMIGPWEEQQTVETIQVHQAALPYFREAFENIVAAGVQDHAKYFNGTFALRRIRGADARWSAHAWAVSIDIELQQNSFRSGPDGMTMHPGVVQAFKQAGFVWGGDGRGWDGASFTISTDTLAEIEDSAVDFRTGCSD